MSLPPGIFEHEDPAVIARALKQAADHSTRRKTGPFRSAMSMLVFFINRAGKTLPEARLKVLEQAKDELRALYARPTKAGA